MLVLIAGLTLFSLVARSEDSMTIQLNEACSLCRRLGMNFNENFNRY